MRPALQKLVARPAARELLRLLVGNEGAVRSYAPAITTPKEGHRRAICRRNGCAKSASIMGYSSAAVTIREVECCRTGRFQATATSCRQSYHRPTAPPPKLEGSFSRALAPTGSDENFQLVSHNPWDEAMWSHEQLEYESSLDSEPDPKRPRLLDTVDFRDDLHLWSTLLGYRKRVYGNAGVVMFWNAIRERDVQIPTYGPLADRLWGSFLDAGFEDPSILEEIHQYTSSSKSDPPHWTQLYNQIVQHFLLSHEATLAKQWHKRLKHMQHPQQKYFVDMCRQVISKNGAFLAMRHMYIESKFRNLYSEIIPLLCERELYKAAVTWHFTLVKRGDIPPTARVAQPLVSYLVSYDPAQAQKVTKSLVEAGVSFAATLSKELEDSTKISREMMNLIHGQTIDVPVKHYNDSLGARWFATNWVSMDVAINAVTALGVEEIGPLSLQAIALRDPDPQSIIARIDQLKAAGISIGNSLYSQAIDNFARTAKHDILYGLLKSDQHPDELENYELQEALLASHAQCKDWLQYRTTLEIRLLRSTSPEVDRRNVELRVITSTSDISATLDGIEDMIIDGIPVKDQTTALILRHILGPRRRGHRPVELATSSRRLKGKHSDVDIAVAMMKSIVKSGTYVHPCLWHELIRRLGMSGRLQAQRELCLWLAAMYRGNSDISSRWAKRYHVPSEVPTSHANHPLKLLFPVGLQKAIVEWGFIESASQQDLPPTKHTRKLIRDGHCEPRGPASGVFLLKDLNSLGVHIESEAVRKAIFDRLIIYYGPGTSRKRYNQRAKINIGGLETVARQIDEALGHDYFTAVALPEIVHGMALSRLQRLVRGRHSQIRRGAGVQSKDARIRYMLSGRWLAEDDGKSISERGGE